MPTKDRTKGRAAERQAKRRKLAGAGPVGAPPPLAVSAATEPPVAMRPWPTATTLPSYPPVTEAQAEANHAVAKWHEDREAERARVRNERLEFYRAQLAGRPAGVEFTIERREEFLLALEAKGSVLAACDLVGISTHPVYRLRKHDEEFRRLWEEALDRYRDHIRDEVHRRGVEGWEEPVYQQGQFVGVKRVFSDRMLELLAKAHAPEFREQTKIEHTGAVTTVAVAATLDELEKAVRDDPEKRAALRLLLGAREEEKSRTAAGPAPANESCGPGPEVVIDTTGTER